MKFDNLKNKVIVDFYEYHKNISELELLRDLIISFKFNDITKDELFDEINKANKKYRWWI